MKPADILTCFPRWTERVFVEAGGRDPLGLSRVSDNIVDRLLPAIITTTDRARYHSFYAWAIREVGETAGGSEEAFRERFRRLEAAFATASRLGRETDLPIIGITQVNIRVPNVESGQDLDTAFPVLPSNNLGGLGQYYLGCVAKLGIADYGEEEFLSLWEGRGTTLADAFAESVSKAPITHLKGEEWNQIPAPVLQKSAKIFSLDGLRAPSAKHERDLLTRIFLDFDEDAPEGFPGHRQGAIGQFLHVLTCYEEHGISVPRKQVDKLCLFFPHYYGQLCGAEDAVFPYTVTPELADESAYWRQFCAHQFFTYASEDFFQGILTALSGPADGLDRESLLDALFDTGFVQDLHDCLGVGVAGPADVIESFGFKDDRPETALKAQADFSGDETMSEWWVISGEYEGSPGTSLGRAFSIWCQLYAKWRWSGDSAMEEVLASSGRDWCLGTCFDWGDQWIEHRPSWRTVLSEMLDVFHERHELVRFQKHKLEASWLEKQRENYLRLQDLKVQFRASRHPNMTTILQDLGLLEDGGLDDPLKVTARGREMLRRVIKGRQ